MDNAMMQRLLQTYGAPTTPANIARAQEFFGANPDVAERRAMGMRGSGIDDNSDLLGPMLDRVMQQTDRISPGRVDVGEPVVVAPPTASPPTNAGAASRATQIASVPQGGGGGGIAPNTEPPGGSLPPDSGDGGWLPWLIGLIGGPAAVYALSRLGSGNGPGDVADRRLVNPQSPEATYAGKMPREDFPAGTKSKELQTETAPTRNRIGYEPKLVDQSPSPSSAPSGKMTPQVTGMNDAAPGDMTTGGGGSVVRSSPENEKEARRRQLQAEIDQENREANSVLRAQLEKQAAEQRTRELLKSAGRVTGRR